VSGVEELDYNAYLQHVGLALVVEEQEDLLKPSLELEFVPNGVPFTIGGVKFDGAAYHGGIMTGDVLLMLNDERAVETTLQSRLNAIGVGGEAQLQVLRGDRLVPVVVTLGEDRPVTYTIVEAEKATRAQKKTRESWLAPYAK